MLVLGIESSCDETAVAIVDSHKNILSNMIWSQGSQHNQFGGVVPEVAARAHTEAIFFCIKEAFIQANVKQSDIDAIAVTAGPGLIGGLRVGIAASEAMSLTLGIPLLAINHMEGHLLTPRLFLDIDFPYLALLLSGGHSQFVIAKDLGDYYIIGNTLDDAAGEAFDKTARLLGLDYPGGKQIEILAKSGNENKYSFNPPLYYRDNCDFSFSGLKTQVLNLVNKVSNQLDYISDQDRADIAKAFEVAMVQVINKKSEIAITKFKKVNNCRGGYFIASGGVAANQSIRSGLNNIAAKHGLNFYSPSLEFCGDNAAMIAWAGLERLLIGKYCNISKATALPNWSLDDISF